jgi:DNA-binding response OmpR family regulator
VSLASNVYSGLRAWTTIFAVGQWRDIYMSRAQKKHNVRERILLVEDDLRIRRNLASFLRIEGYQVNEASNGKEAIELLQKDEIDLVLSDVVMPGPDGFHLLRHVRSVTPEIPVFLMSGFFVNPQQIVKEGAADFITKPFHLTELLSKLKLVLKER